MQAGISGLNGRGLVLMSHGREPTFSASGRSPVWFNRGIPEPDSRTNTLSHPANVTRTVSPLPGRAGALLLRTAVLFLALSAPLRAQQWVTDDIGVVNPDSCQLEVWHGQRSSWVIPGCEAIPNLELSIAAGLAEVERGDRQSEYALQAKTVLRAARAGNWGMALGAGVGVSHEGHFGSVYAYVPVGWSLGEDRVLLYSNLGWRYTQADRMHVLTYGARGDWAVAPRLSLIGEVFGANGDDLPPEYQIGGRITVLPNRLRVDLTFGGWAEPGDFGRGGGWTVGVAYTPGP